MFEKSSCRYQNVLDPPKSTPVAHGGNPQTLAESERSPGKMIVEYSHSESFRNVQRVVGPNALKNSDFTARLYLKNLPPDKKLFYRVIFQDLDYQGTYSVPFYGTFRTPPKSGRDIFFVWG
jgi:alkaline phosphatase D